MSRCADTGAGAGRRRHAGAPPPPRSPGAARARAAIPGLALVWLAIACAGVPGPEQGPGYDFFAPASPGEDVWYEKVAEWQTRAREDEMGPLPPPPEPGTPPNRLKAAPSPSGTPPLPEKLSEFAHRARHRLARDIFQWTRRTAPFYYQWDADEKPEDDHWPTYSELVARNGDDCDGLDLMAYRLLIDFGFPREQLYRAIVRRDRDAANHMVTLWFEDREDPWVFDASGVVSSELIRFSAVEGWTPTHLFNEREQYAIRKRGVQPLRTTRAHHAEAE